MKGPLTESEKLELTKETFDESDFPMFWCNYDHFLLFNKAFLSISGYSSDELYQIGFDSLSHSENAFNSLADIHSGSDSRQMKVLSWLMAKKGGKEEFYELRLTRLSDGNKKQDRFYGVMRPLEKFEPKNEVFADTALRLQDSLAASRQGIWQWLSVMNRATILDKYIGLSKTGKSEVAFDESSFLEKVYPRDRMRVRLTWRHFLKGNDDYYFDEYRICNKDDEFIWVCAKGKVMERKTDGSPLRIAGTISDINDEKEKQEIILRQTQKLIDYAFMNSHLLRGPATSIIGLVDLLMEENNRENLVQLKVVSAQLDEAIHKINDMIAETRSNFQLTPSKVSKISLISNDSLKSLIFQASLKQYREKIELNLNENHPDSLLSHQDKVNTDLVIFDEKCCD
ncbi:MAG TPA: PAS domain-containing protein, partial [Cryomorphaceae bacterium]|nr:PAS domain-containing protein [Cryomorphaceae bacterium]